MQRGINSRDAGSGAGAAARGPDPGQPSGRRHAVRDTAQSVHRYHAGATRDAGRFKLSGRPLQRRADLGPGRGDG